MTEKPKGLFAWNVYCEPICEVDTVPLMLLLISINIHLFFSGSFPHKYYPFKNYLPLARDRIISDDVLRDIFFNPEHSFTFFVFGNLAQTSFRENILCPSLHFWASLIGLTTKGNDETSRSRHITWANESFRGGYVS